MSEVMGYEVLSTITGANPLLPTYPLLHGDLLVEEPGGTFMKEAPGLAVGGFVLTGQDREKLRAIRFARQGLNYTKVEVESS